VFLIILSQFIKHFLIFKLASMVNGRGIGNVTPHPKKNFETSRKGGWPGFEILSDDFSQQGVTFFRNWS